MRARIGWIVAACVAVAAVAFGQGVNQSNPGLTGRGAVFGINPDPTNQRSSITYTWPYMVNAGTSSGWTVTQTKTNGVALSSLGLALTFAGADTACRVRLAEMGVFAGNAAVPFASGLTGDIKLVFSVLSAEPGDPGAGDFIEVAYGDTSSVCVDRKAAAFGVFWGDATNARIPANMRLNQFIAFVGDGSDTTYVPIGEASGNAAGIGDKFYIHAEVGGPVVFFHDGIQRASIASPVLPGSFGTGFRGIVITANGVPADRIGVGPIQIEREW